MSLTLRRNKGAALTHTEMDDNFVYLDNKTINNTVDSDYVRARADSDYVTGIIDSAYITNVVQTAPTRPVLEAFNLADSATFNTFAAGSMIFLNDGNNGDPCIAVKDSAAGNFRIIAFGAVPSGGGGF